MKKFFSLSIILRIISAALLFGALAKNPYDYYTLLRLATCATSAYCAFLAKQLKSQIWLVVFSILAVLFNPVLPLRFSRDSWTLIDIATALFFLVSIFVFSENKKK
jgi:predicted neutral ceramidase superfamily lipid hydrolase